MLEIHVDSSYRTKTGLAAIAMVVSHNGEELFSKTKEMPTGTTNNAAEYSAILFAVQTVIDANQPATIYSDSMLAVNQINGGWKINFEHLKALRQMIVGLIENYSQPINILYVPREQNVKANKLSQKLSGEMSKAPKKAYLMGTLDSIE